MMHREHPGEAMTGKPGAFPSEAIRRLIQIVAPYALDETGEVLLVS